ncbi:MAG: hypothetical protein HZA81_00315 [Candidatus Taylorbacteria bacterium]|nr:hypothetical protein [Candidatus Taylorbacteria bacterium]
MDIKSKIITALFVLLLIGVSVWKYKVFIVDRDFTIYGTSSCDLFNESCFAMDCSESDPECDLTPYKKIEKMAYNVPRCGPLEECDELTCSQEEEGCYMTSCSEESLEEGEVCITVEAQPMNEAATTTDDELTGELK